MKAPKKKTFKQLKKELDILVSKYIIKRDGRCVVCGSKERLTNGHLFSRINMSTRWDITEDGNCHCQCQGCNLRHEFDFYPYQNWYVRSFGQVKYDLLHKRHREATPTKAWMLEEKIDEVKGRLSTYLIIQV